MLNKLQVGWTLRPTLRHIIHKLLKAKTKRILRESDAKGEVYTKKLYLRSLYLKRISQINDLTSQPNLVLKELEKEERK